MQDDFLPSKDFFNFDFYKIAESETAHFTGDLENATWGIITIHMQNAQEELLQNMLKAVGVSLQQGATVLQVPAMTLLSLSDYVNHFPKVQYWLIFGFNATAMGWQFDVPFYKPINWKEKKIIFADALALIQNDLSKKKILWQGLQQII